MKRENYLLKIKVTPQQKELIRKAAHEAGLSINDFILSSTEEAAKRKVSSIANKEIIEARIENTEKNLEDLKSKLAGRRNKSRSLQDIVLKFK